MPRIILQMRKPDADMKSLRESMLFASLQQVMVLANPDECRMRADEVYVGDGRNDLGRLSDGFPARLVDQPFYGSARPWRITSTRFHELRWQPLHAEALTRRTLKHQLDCLRRVAPALKGWPTNPPGKPRKRGQGFRD